jgi:RND family efflux transporter MFP subunit
MALFRQALVTTAALLIGGSIWLAVDERPGAYLLGLGLPGPVNGLVAALAPAGSEPAKAGAKSQTPAKAGGRGSARPTIVVAGEVRTSLTRNQMRAIGTGEAERSVTVYPDVTGIIETVPFKSGDRVAVGDTLANLESDTEKLAVDRARIALAAAEEKVARVERLQASLAITQVEVTAVGRELQNAQLDLRAAEIALRKRKIFAPIDGRVGIVSVDTGDLVSNQTVITTIDDREQLKVIFYTPENIVQELAIGEEVEAVSTARPEKIHVGRISAIDSRLDEASRTLRTEATIDNAADELRPGMSFSISMRLAGERLLSVDPLSVQWERKGPIVWRIAGDTADKVPVRIIERNIDRVLVTSTELKEGDIVVVEGVQALREAGKVEIQNADALKPAAVPTADGAPAAVPASGTGATGDKQAPITLGAKAPTDGTAGTRVE